MAHSLCPDPEPRTRTGSMSAAGSNTRDEMGKSLAHWASTLAAHGGGTLSPDLALDLVLNEIVERVHVDTRADAAAIALVRDEEIVCRATTGGNAPDLGTRLNTRTGLSGACVQTKQWQRCDDTEADTRVDPEVCRRLGVRAILIAPVLKEAELLGVVEIFSSTPHAFGEAEVQRLEAFSQDILASIEIAAGMPKSTAADAPVPALDNAEPASMPAPMDFPPAANNQKAGQSDYWTNALLLVIIALAVTLGWIVGRAGWLRSTRPSAGNAKLARLHPSTSTAEANAVRPTDGGTATEPASTATDKSRSSATSSNSLVIYQNGKVIFRAPSKADTAEPPQAAMERREAEAAPLRISWEIARGYLAARVEPDYPEQARQQRIQGTVVLDALVGKDGTVEKLTPVSGDPQLADAAVHALLQWRFHPFFRSGQPEEFVTSVPVMFKLP